MRIWEYMRKDHRTNVLSCRPIRPDSQMVQEDDNNTRAEPRLQFVPPPSFEEDSGLLSRSRPFRIILVWLVVFLPITLCPAFVPTESVEPGRSFRSSLQEAPSWTKRKSVDAKESSALRKATNASPGLLLVSMTYRWLARVLQHDVRFFPKSRSLSRHWPASYKQPPSYSDELARKRRAATRGQFSFAVLSDTHSYTSCALKQGRWIESALEIINRRKPDFVIGLGDLVAGGGDCLDLGSKGASVDLERQLDHLDEALLSRLEAPFVPVSGNHDLSTMFSRSSSYPKRAWHRFWRAKRKRLLKGVASQVQRTSFRFQHKGVGFAMIGYYGSYGFSNQERKWIRANLKPGDLVFRHVNPYVITMEAPGKPGYAVRGNEIREYTQLTEIIKRRRVKALFSGHTHAFYDGVCDGLRFINTGSLADRAMEYIEGLERTTYHKRQAFVWVDVLGGKSKRIKVTFYVYDGSCNCFRVFDKTSFPPIILSRRHRRNGYDEGVPAVCRSVRTQKNEEVVHRPVPCLSPRRP